jgi:hypothetical protein
MKLKLVKHPKTYFGFKKVNAYWNGTLKTFLSFAFAKYRLLLLY